MEWSRLQQPQFWLLGLASTLIALHLALVNRSGDEELFATSLLFWVAAGSLIWDRRRELPLSSGMAASLGGVAVLGLLLLRSAVLTGGDGFLRLFPLVAGTSLVLLASGLQQFRSYWKELLLFGVMAIHPVLAALLRSLNLPLLTAQASTFLLWYTGTEVKRDGVFLNLPGGWQVEVYETCSGVSTILLMLNIAVLFLLMVPLRSRTQGIVCLVVAVLTGFLVNTARVALMAMLVAQQSAFEYWHTGGGSMIFSMISVALFGGFCWLAFLRQPTQGSQA